MLSSFLSAIFFYFLYLTYSVIDNPLPFNPVENLIPCFPKVIRTILLKNVNDTPCLLIFKENLRDNLILLKKRIYTIIIFIIIVTYFPTFEVKFSINKYVSFKLLITSSFWAFQPSIDSPIKISGK